MVKTLHNNGTCRHDKNSVKKNWRSTEELATFDTIGIDMVKCLHSELVDYDKIIFKNHGIVLKNCHDNIGRGQVKNLHSELMT